MKVFLSWSGSRSREAALLFRDWLPQVIQAVDPWMSDVDIEKGAQWFAEISREVSAASFGIVFLTRENLEKPWLHFEAGALAKALSNDGGSAPRVAAYLLGIEPTDVVGPLKEFQHTKPTGEDTLKLLGSLNNGLAAKEEKALKDEVLKSIFATFWPKLEGSLKKVIELKETGKPRREVRDMVEEILEYVRPRAQRRGRASIAESEMAAQFAAAQNHHRALQERMLMAEQRLMAEEAALASVPAEARKHSAAIKAELDRTKASFIENEVRLMTLREELAAARARALPDE